MKVDLIDFTGYESEEIWYAARLLVYVKNTRLEQGDETRKRIWAMGEDELMKELDYIAKTIRSSWEFVDYTFEIKDVTRAFTHQLVRTRTASYAQQAQRVVSMNDFKALLPDTVKEDSALVGQWEACMTAIKTTYSFLQNHGVPNQDCRGVLPTNVLTNIITKMNLRTLADVIGKRENLRAQGEYAAVARAMKRLVLDVHPWARPFLEPERTQTPNLDTLLAEALGSSSPIDRPKINAALKEVDALKGTWG